MSHTPARRDETPLDGALTFNGAEIVRYGDFFGVTWWITRQGNESIPEWFCGYAELPDRLRSSYEEIPVTGGVTYYSDGVVGFDSLHHGGEFSTLERAFAELLRMLLWLCDERELMEDM